MSTLLRLMYREVLMAVAFVTLGFVGLFYFFDIADELQWVGRNGPDGYQLRHALVYVLWLIPGHLYELMPITVLIGTIFVMARLAQSSEFTILRTSGLGPGRALQMLLGLGLIFVVLTVAVGDYLAPVSDRQAQLLRARYRGGITVGQTGAWLKERQGDNAVFVNVGRLNANGDMQDLRMFEFDAVGALRALTEARSGSFARDESWSLREVSRSTFGTRPDGTSMVTRSHAEALRWPTQISAEMVSVALLKPERMGTLDLYHYVQHLEVNGQAAQRYEIEFWRKVFYPLSCLVMVVLALPFAYLHFRSGSIAGYVFVGVMIGVSFFLLNNVFGYIGNLSNWQPWLAAAAPGLLYSLLSLGALVWLVLRR